MRVASSVLAGVLFIGLQTVILPTGVTIPGIGISRAEASDISDKVKNIIAYNLRVDEKDVVPTASIVDDLGADQLDAVTLLIELESQFNIRISDEQLDKITTVGDLIDFIEKNAGK